MAKNEAENQIIKILNYKPPMAVKDIDKYKSLTDPVTRALFEDEKDMQEGGKKIKSFKFANNSYKDVVFDLQWKFENPGDKIDLFDKAVYDAVCTLYQRGFKIQTTQQIYEVMTGKTYKSMPQQKILINESMERLRHLNLYLSAEDGEIKLYKSSKPKYPHNINGMRKEKLDGIKRVFKEGYCVSWEKAGIELVNGVKISAYIIISVGIGWDYAEWAKQILTVPRKAYELPIRSSRNSIAIRTVLLSLIHYKKEKPDIRIEKLFKKAGIEGTTRQNEKLFKTINKILDTWKLQKLIKDYYYVKKGRNSHYKLVIDKKPEKSLKKGGQNG